MLPCSNDHEHGNISFVPYKKDKEPTLAAQRKTSTPADPFKITMLIFAIIAFMYFAGEVLKPLALSVLLSFALAPVARLPRAAPPAPGCRGCPDRPPQPWDSWAGSATSSGSN